MPPLQAKVYGDSQCRAPVNNRPVLCGLSYKKWKYKLKGTINDVQNMKDLLTQNYGFEEQNIVVLTLEEQLDARLIPTKANIENCLRWLVEGTRSGDSLVFYYSGHGLRQPDFNQDELDGFDETICPPLPKGVTLHAIVDACYSGTILDLKHVYNKKTCEEKTSGGLAYSISACDNDHVAADTSTMNGAMTFVLIEVVRGRGQRNITYGELLEEMEDRIEQANQQGCLGGSRILSKLFGPDLTQSECIKWLDSKELESVIYVNFGSTAVTSPQHLIEVSWGLASSMQPFLWIIKPDLVEGEATILPPEFITGTKGRGLLASWCRQDEVLKRPSVGGFLSHMGWNSTIESISARVPMLCLPNFADQQTNTWLACTKLGICMEIDEDVKRDQVEMLARELIVGEKGIEMKAKAIELKKRAKEAFDHDGSSSRNLDNLLTDVLCTPIV
ncbi:7-deoxyloganetin glucosyltransferase [Hibiscus syriacus]|uniref:7-deoxyloganetin glucosyltransferase n=1 Tax=Hibiscus syriacus TaxID=106335 RepID=A0A6A2YB56_HIBSY|nr:7-deoxyloganetin glucosyltransferase [Hibiscus syriacus]